VTTPSSPALRILRYSWLADARGLIRLGIGALAVAWVAALLLRSAGETTLLVAVPVALVGVGALGGLLLHERAKQSAPSVLTGSIAPVDDPIRTDRLLIRAPTPADQDGLVATIDDEVRRANGWTALAERSIVVPIGWSDGFAGDTGVLVLCDAAGTVLGEANARPRSDRDAWEIGWWIGPAWRRQGFATEAAGGLIERLHERGVATVVFGCRADNVAIVRLAASVGAETESTGPFALPDGSQPDAVWFVHERVRSDET
jgi:RimJ/RimL family protein N-acetyltransferase